MSMIFQEVLDMSLTASYVIVFVIVARFCMKRLPKIYSYALWSVVLFRLLCPFSFESDFSLVPTYQESVIAEHVSNEVIQNFTPTPTQQDELPEVTVSVTIIDVISNYIKFVWILGVAIILGVNLLSMVKLKSTLKSSTHMYDNIYSSENIGTAFVLGLVKPKIYLPVNLEDNEQEFILLHEQTHIKRLDNITSFIGFIALSLHWFNPLVWLAFSLANKDMEMSCDESVIQKLGKTFNKSCKKEYAHSLLSFAVGRKLVSPLAFSEGSVNDTKQRINNIVSYKKPTLFIGLVTVFVVLFLIIGFGLDSATPLKDAGVTLVDYGISANNYKLKVNSNTTLDNGKITASIGSNNGIIPATGDIASFGDVSRITINTDEWTNNSKAYDIWLEELAEDYSINFVFELEQPFSIITQAMTEPIYSRNGYIYTNSNVLGFDVNSSNFEITINQELPDMHEQVYSETKLNPQTPNTYHDGDDNSHLEVTTIQLNETDSEIIIHNTITGETESIFVSSPPTANNSL